MELVIIQKKIFVIRGQRVMLDLHFSGIVWCGNKTIKAASE